MLMFAGQKKSHEQQLVLSCIQFHDGSPFETVLTVPVDLPDLEVSTNNVSVDDPLSQCVSEPHLKLRVVTHPSGIVCVCHHYINLPKTSTSNSSYGSLVELIYSVTVIHHGCVIRVVTPGIIGDHSQLYNVLFSFIGDTHLLVLCPGVFFHLLDVCMDHEPSHHIFLPLNSENPQPSTPLHPVFGNDNKTHSLLLVSPQENYVYCVTVERTVLVDLFDWETPLPIRLAVLHYYLVHDRDLGIVKELMLTLGEDPADLDVPHILEEFLVSGAYSTVTNSLSTDVKHLYSLLPLSVVKPLTDMDLELDSGKPKTSITYEILSNMTPMLLSSCERIHPSHTDMWTRLWEHLRGREQGRARFSPHQVTEKLMISLDSYQPEILSRATTPMSPASPFVCGSVLSDLNSIMRGGYGDPLPFPEIESATASKIEHVVSVNLREVSTHLLKKNSMDSPMHIHAVASRYVSAQMRLSRELCLLMFVLADVHSEREGERGFRLIDQLNKETRSLLFLLLERYHYTTEALAFPLPQGFASFFTYLGFRVLGFPFFVQYIQRGVLDLNIDVMKIIMYEIPDDKSGVQKKLQLISALPRTRACRILNQWNHPLSYILRAREHAHNILTGVEGVRDRRLRGSSNYHDGKAATGLAAFPSDDRLSPFDTFLNLLTAKADITKLDLGLLMEATVASTEVAQMENVEE